MDRPSHPLRLLLPVGAFLALSAIALAGPRFVFHVPHIAHHFAPDADGDGYARVGWPGGADCDDTKPAVHPGATELCDGIDNDCDGAVDGADAADATAFYADADGDGYGDPGTRILSCTAPAGMIADGTDCDDADSAQHPGAVEACDDGEDNDCNGLLDCEETSCTADPACAETDCSDGLDDDGDGEVDCDDSDYWGPSCAITSARVTGGRMHVKIKDKEHFYDTVGAPCDKSFATTKFTDTADVDSVSGTVQVQPGPGAPVVTCTWSAAHVDLNYRYHRHSTKIEETTYISSGTTAVRGCTVPVTARSTSTIEAAPTRTGFAVSSACPVGSSAFLPSALHPRYNYNHRDNTPWLTEDGTEWYGGASVRTYYTTVGFTGSGSAGGKDVSSFETDPLLPDGSYDDTVAVP